jgi:hypothetical protein
MTQARRVHATAMASVFGGLAIMVTGVTLDPLALRRRLSPVLPLSKVLLWIQYRIVWATKALRFDCAGFQICKVGAAAKGT